MRDADAPFRMPAEWEPHRATWVAWPHRESDFPGKLDAVRWAYVEIIRLLGRSEPVEVIVASEADAEELRARLRRARASGEVRLHVVATDRSWVRDSLPTGVVRPDGTAAWAAWRFDAWSKYDDFAADAALPAEVGRVTSRDVVVPRRPEDPSCPVTLEGGAFDTDGEGTLLVTEECLLSDVQVRNPGLDKRGYEEVFSRVLGVQKVVWLGRGCEGDDTHGHVDDVARFVAPGHVVLSFQADPSDPDHEASADNEARLFASTDAAGRPVRVTRLPAPSPHYLDDAQEGDAPRLPASYANFYIGNRVVLVPTFNDPNDRVALSTLAPFFPGRQTIGVSAVDLVAGFGTLHCLTQQEPVG